MVPGTNGFNLMYKPLQYNSLHLQVDYDQNENLMTPNHINRAGYIELKIITFDLNVWLFSCYQGGPACITLRSFRKSAPMPSATDAERSFRGHSSAGFFRLEMIRFFSCKTQTGILTTFYVFE